MTLSRRDVFKSSAMYTVILTASSKSTPAAASSATYKAAAALPASSTLPPPHLALTETQSQFASGLLAGAAQKTVKELALHPFDTVKTRLQTDQSRRDALAALFDQPYAGLAPALLTGAPAAALFFAVKDSLKQRARVLQWSDSLATLGAVLGANVAYWVVRNPTEVIKTRRQAGVVEDALEAARELWRTRGASGFYTGYVGNCAYAYPVDAGKFLIYDAVKREWRRRKGGAKLTSTEAAIGGALAAAVTQATFTPLDVGRTRIMTRGGAADAPSGLEGLVDIITSTAASEGVGALYAGVAPKTLRALASGALQFSTYELIKEWADRVIGSQRVE